VIRYFVHQILLTLKQSVVMLYSIVSKMTSVAVVALAKAKAVGMNAMALAKAMVVVVTMKEVTVVLGPAIGLVKAMIGEVLSVRQSIQEVGRADFRRQ